MTRYSTRHLLQIFKDYQFENGRENKEDAKITKNIIKKELKERLQRALILLDECEDANEVVKIYNQFIEF